jgi:GTP-binding protein Era
MNLDPADFAPIPPGHKSGYVALVGAPNVGKSTLMNALVGARLSIVTDKPSTTRHRVIGLLSSEGDGPDDPGYQVVFLDTPGVVHATYKLHDAMMRQVDRAVSDADILVLMVDASRGHVERRAFERIPEEAVGDRPCLLVLNKMDLIPHDEALPLVEAYAAERSFDAIVPISAEKGFNLDKLQELLLERLPEGPPYYPKDQLSEHPERFFVSELVREAIFDRYRAEIPYSTQVNVIQYEAKPEGEKDFIDCEIVVERNTQKAILIGKGGRALKALGRSARERVEAFIGKGVYLQLHVKTRQDWRNRTGFLRDYGYLE